MQGSLRQEREDGGEVWLGWPEKVRTRIGPLGGSQDSFERLRGFLDKSTSRACGF